MSKFHSILLAEDDPDDQRIASEAMAKALPNAQLFIVNNGNEVLEYLRGAETLPHVFITDIQMPELTGLEVLELLKKDSTFSHIPVVILSTSREPSDIQQSKRLGAALYITKPQLFKEWVAALQQITELLPV